MNIVDVVYYIQTFLLPSDVCKLSGISQLWERISTSNEIWKNLYERKYGKEFHLNYFRAFKIKFLEINFQVNSFEIHTNFQIDLRKQSPCFSRVDFIQKPYIVESMIGGCIETFCVLQNALKLPPCFSTDLTSNRDLVNHFLNVLSMFIPKSFHLILNNTSMIFYMLRNGESSLLFQVDCPDSNFKFFQLKEKIKYKLQNDIVELFGFNLLMRIENVFRMNTHILHHLEPCFDSTEKHFNYFFENHKKAMVFLSEGGNKKEIEFSPSLNGSIFHTWVDHLFSDF
jgi:hypothetical protein